MARPKKLYSLKQIQEKTGISYPTLINYVRDHGEEIPSEGEGRSRRYPTEAIKVFERIRASKRPGRRPAETPGLPAKAPVSKQRRKAARGAREAQDRSATATPAVPSSLRLEPVGPLQLAEEDRQLIRDLIEAVRDLGGNVRSLSMGVGEVSTSLHTGGTGDVGSSRKKPAKKAAQKRSPRRGASEAERELLTRAAGEAGS